MATSLRRQAGLAALAIIAGALILTATVSPRTSDLASHAQAMSTYESAAAAISRRQQADALVAARRAQSIFLGHGGRTPTAVLLLHGYTNSPEQFDSLARMLYREGDNVYVPRLPHHAELVHGSAALSRLTAEDLRAAADSAVDVVEGLGDTVVVVGLSLGGTMAEWIAQYRRGARRVIMVAPLMGLAHVPVTLDVPLMNLAIRLPNVKRVDESDSEPDRTLGWSSHSVGQILRFGLAVERASVDTTPANGEMDVLLNGHDHTISAHPVFAVDRHWRAHGATVHEYEISANLLLPHDVIDPRQPVRRLDVVYPVLEDLISGRAPVNTDVKDISRGGNN